jgi:hypothetical protein
VRETLGRLDAGLLEVAAHLGLAPSLLRPAPVAKGDWHTVEQPAATTVQMLGFARATVSESLGVPLPELPDVEMLEPDASATPTAKSGNGLVLAPAALGIRRLRAGWARLPPGSLLVVLSGELEVHRKSMVEKEHEQEADDHGGPAIDAAFAMARNSSSEANRHADWLHQHGSALAVARKHTRNLPLRCDFLERF